MGAKNNAISKDTFGNCARTFLRAQIELVEPRFVLVLGLLAWNGLMEAFSLAPRSMLKEAFQRGHLPLNKSTIAFPLFHCGSKLHLNRSLHLQIDYWKKMKAIMDKHPLRPVTTFMKIGAFGPTGHTPYCREAPIKCRDRHVAAGCCQFLLRNR
jgi:hypothetical protein